MGTTWATKWCSRPLNRVLQQMHTTKQAMVFKIKKLASQKELNASRVANCLNPVEQQQNFLTFLQFLKLVSNISSPERNCFEVNGCDDDREVHKYRNDSDPKPERSRWTLPAHLSNLSWAKRRWDAQRSVDFLLITTDCKSLKVLFGLNTGQPLSYLEHLSTSDDVIHLKPSCNYENH